MALLHMDGFDDGLGALKWNQYADQLSPGRTGSGAMRLHWNGQPGARKLLSTSVSSPVIIGFAYRASVGGGAVFATSQDFLGIGLGIVPWVDTGAGHVYLRCTTNFGLEVGRGGMWGLGGAKTTLGTSANNVLAAGIWQYIEIKVVIHATTGSITVRVNGANVINLTNVNTQTGGSALIDTVALSSSFSGFWQDFDDLYWCDSTGANNNDFLGDCLVETLYPNGNGNYSQFIGSDTNSVDNYLLVNEIAPNTTNYVSAAVNSNKDTYTFDNLIHTVGTVKAVTVRSYAAKSDVGAKSISNVVRSGGTDNVRASQVLGTSFGLISDILEVNPVGPAAWTIASVNAAEFGVAAAA